MPCHGRIFDLSDAFPPRTAFQTSTVVSPSCLDRYRSIYLVFLATMRVSRVLFDEMYSLFGSRRSSPLICSWLSSISSFSLIRSVPSWAEFLYIFYNNFVPFPRLPVTFRDCDSILYSVCIHIFPRRIRAYQVSTFLCANKYERGISDLASASCIIFLSMVSFFPFHHDVVSR